MRGTLCLPLSHDIDINISPSLEDPVAFMACKNALDDNNNPAWPMTNNLETDDACHGKVCTLCDG